MTLAYSSLHIPFLWKNNNMNVVLLLILFYTKMYLCIQIPIKVNSVNKDCTRTKFKSRIICYFNSVNTLEVDVHAQSMGQDNGHSMPVTVDSGSPLTWVVAKDTITWKMKANGKMVVPNDLQELYERVPTFLPTSSVVGKLIKGRHPYVEDQILKYKLWPDQIITIGDVSTNPMLLAVATEWTADVPPPSANGILGLRLSQGTPHSNILCEWGKLGIKRFSIFLSKGNDTYTGMLGLNETEFEQDNRSIILPSNGLLWDVKMIIEARWRNTEWIRLSITPKTGTIDSGAAEIWLPPSFFSAIAIERAKVMVEGKLRNLDLKILLTYLGGRKDAQSCQLLETVLPYMLRFTVTEQGKTMSITINQSDLILDVGGTDCFAFLIIGDPLPDAQYEYTLGIPFMVNVKTQFDFSSQPQTITLRKL